MSQHHPQKIQSLGTEHSLYRFGSRTLVVRKEGDSWTCLAIPRGALVGTFMAHGTSELEALQKGLARYRPAPPVSAP